MVPSVTTHSSFTKSVAMSKVGIVLCRASSKKSMNSIGGISYYLNKIILAVIKHVVDDNIKFYLSVSARQLIHVPAHGARNTVQQLLSKTQLHICWVMAPIGQSWTQLITRFKKSTAAWTWAGSQQNRRNQTATGWTPKSSNDNIWVQELVRRWDSERERFTMTSYM